MFLPVSRTRRHVLVLTLLPAWIAAVNLLGVSHGGAQPQSEEADTTAGSSVIAIPDPVKVEHEQLHQNLKQAMQTGGETGEAARRVQKALADHFEQENQLVMPLLGLLKPLADGEINEEMRPAIAMSQKVKEQLPRFMKEHRAIHEAVDRLEKAAKSEGKVDVGDFARRLRLHAQHEEAILYPAAILVGQRVEAALNGSPRRSQ